MRFDCREGKSPACVSYAHCLLAFKGFLALKRIGCRVGILRSASASGDCRFPRVPSSPPPPSTSTNSVGVSEENETVELETIFEAVVDDKLAVGATSGEGRVSGSQNLEGKPEEKRTGSPERAGSLNEIGKEISELRRERAATGLQDPASTTDFWRGVAKETSLIDWPVFSKVLGTTGVVVAMILGSFVVVLTVNTILAASSDFIFNEHVVWELANTQ